MNKPFNILKFEDYLIRTFINDEIDDEIESYIIDKTWFIAMDVCKALKFKNNKNALKMLDKKEKCLFPIDFFDNQKMLAISEFGFYSLLLISDTIVGKKLRQWIVSNNFSSLCEIKVIENIQDGSFISILSLHPHIMKLNYMTNIKTFKFEDKSINIIVDNAKNISFVASDLCLILSISKDPYQGTYWLDENQKNITFIGTSGNKQEVIIINETGLDYFFKMNKSVKSEYLRYWINDKIIPTIRKKNLLL